MALSPQSEVYAVASAQITPLLTDPTSGSATYGTAVAIPGIKSVTLTPNANVKELMGDNTLLDSKSVVNYCECKITFAKWSFDVWPIFQGGVVTSSGTTPDQVTTYDWSYQRGSYFKLEAAVAGADPVAGDFHLVVWKMNILTPPPLNLVEEDFSTFEATGRAYKRLSDGKAISTILNETAVAIS